MLGCGRSGSCVYDHSGNRVEDLFKRVMTILLACLLPFASTFYMFVDSYIAPSPRFPDLGWYSGDGGPAEVYN